MKKAKFFWGIISVFWLAITFLFWNIKLLFLFCLGVNKLNFIKIKKIKQNYNIGGPNLDLQDTSFQNHCDLWHWIKKWSQIITPFWIQILKGLGMWKLFLEALPPVFSSFWEISAFKEQFSWILKMYIY